MHSVEKRKDGAKKMLHLEPFSVPFTSSFIFTVVLSIGHYVMNIGHCMLFTPVFTIRLKNEITIIPLMHVAVMLDRYLATEDLQV